MPMVGVQFIVLFGSRARGTESKNSDADVAALADHALDMEEKADLACKIARMLKISEDKIDLVDLWNAPPLLQHRVAEEGKLLRGDPHVFIRFRVLAWKRYLDTAKFRRARERALAKRHAAKVSRT